MTNKRFEIALHESGHAIMGLLFGRKIKLISLKERESPKGTGIYRGVTEFERTEFKEKVTINDEIQEAKISLAGYATEINFLGDNLKVGCDDLDRAVRCVENMMQSADFRQLASKIPPTEPGIFEMIPNPSVRAVINDLLGTCVVELRPYSGAIQLVAKKLYEKDELTGDDVTALLKSGKCD